MRGKLTYCIIILLVCNSCSNGTRVQDTENPKETFRQTEAVEEKDVDTVQEIFMEILPKEFHSLDEKKAVYKINNNSRAVLEMGSQFRIERFENNGWHEVPFIETLGFPDMLYAIDKGSAKEYPLLISLAIGKEHERIGRYRVRKEVWSREEVDKKLELTAEFFITD